MMWYVQVTADDGTWCDYPGMESTSADEALRMLEKVQRMLLPPPRGYARIHPVSSRMPS